MKCSVTGFVMEGDKTRAIFEFPSIDKLIEDYQEFVSVCKNSQVTPANCYANIGPLNPDVSVNELMAQCDIVLRPARLHALAFPKG